MKSVGLILAVVALTLVVGCAEHGKQIYAKSFLNQKAPPLVVEHWITPAPDTKGKFVLLDFWATWCPPCRASIPALNTLHKKFGDKLVIIGLTDEEETDVRKMKDPKIEYFIGSDPKGRTKNDVKVEGIPHALLMDPEGVVRWEGHPQQEGFELTDKVVQEILQQYAKPSPP